MSKPKVIILGGGPAGVGAAYQLHRRQRAQATLIEQKEVVGGNSGSFEWHGQRLDYGSHRLHPACEPEILEDIRRLLGDDLLDRPRHGRILLRGRWIHFPLKPVDLLLRLDRAFAAGTLRDMAAKSLSRGNGAGHETFASVLRTNLGPTICDEFYFPYARKIWGREPEELSAIQARRRVSAGSFMKLARKVLSQVPGMKPPGAGRFYYPRRGYGQISEAYADAARKEGAELKLGWRVAGLEYTDTAHEPWRVTIERNGERQVQQADYVWSTIPISLLARAMSRPQVPEQVARAAGEINYRAMLLIFLQLDVDQFTEYDAHYFPGANVRITRLSEPKNYAALTEPRGRTVLCAELPCAVGDEIWNMSDEALGDLVVADLAQAGIPVPSRPTAVKVQRLSHAYPIYVQGYERPFGILDEWAESLPRLLSYGRQGLFAHDNTHHALYMAYAAVECLDHGQFDQAKWRQFRDVFATHVVED
jgi:protoporphyrinogen oxidase